MSILILGAKKPPTCFDCRHFGLMTTLYSSGMRCPYSTRIILKDEFDESSGVIEGCPIIDVDYCFERAKKGEELMMRIKAVHVDLDKSLARELEMYKNQYEDGVTDGLKLAYEAVMQFYRSDGMMTPYEKIGLFVASEIIDHEIIKHDKT